MLRAEFVAPELAPPCSCCGEGERATVLTAGIYNDEDPYGMFQAIFHRGIGGNAVVKSNAVTKPNPVFRVTLAEWSNAGPVPRETFRLQVWWSNGEDIGVSFVDNADVPADDEGPGIHGLSRAEALAHPRKKEVLDVVDCAMAAGVLQRYLDRPGIQ